MTRLRSGWLGLGLASAYAGWVVLSAAAAGVSPAPQLGAVLVAVTAYAAGWRLRTAHVPLAGAVAVGVLVVVALTGGPFGYANADAALAVQGAAAAATVLVAARRRWLGILAVPVGLLLLGLGATQSWAAGLGGLLVVAATVVSVRGRPRVRSAAGAVVLLAAVLTTVALALAHDREPDLVPSAAVTALSERRLDLWSDALALVEDHPGLGVGPGQFPEQSPTARADRDTRPAHSVWLETAAETGVPGALLLLALAAWPLTRLAGSREGGIGVAAWTALALQASIDYVADFALLMGVAALLLGLASAATGDP